MKRKIIVWFMLGVGCVLLAGFGNVQGNPLMQIKMEPIGPTKLQQISGWSNVMVTWVAPATFNPPTNSYSKQIPARRAVFKVVPKPPAPYVGVFPVLAIHNPDTKMNGIVPADLTFYSSDKFGLMGYNFFTPGLSWWPAFLEVPEAEGNLDATIARFEKEFDGQKLNDGMLLSSIHGVGFQRISPFVFFSEQPTAGSPWAKLNLEKIDIRAGIIRLDVRNSATKKPASYWICPELKKAIKAVVDGREIDLSNTNQPWGEFK